MRVLKKMLSLNNYDVVMRSMLMLRNEVDAI